MPFTREEVDQILRRLGENSQPTKRKVAIHLTKAYNESMSRVELLAKALGGVVIEDYGYRGVIYVEDKKEFVRYHSVHGVHVVLRTPKVWRVVRQMFTADELRPFLEEQGLVPKITPQEKPLDTLAKACGGQVVATFHTGGGVIKAANGVHYRYSNITGLDIVEFVVSKWRSVRKVATRNEVLTALSQDRANDLFAEEARV